MSRFYVGLSVSGHDPAFAVVDDAGRVLFAEATERFLQDKRAWGAAPDHPTHLGDVLATLPLDDATVVVAASWAHAKPSDEEIAGRAANAPDTAAPVESDGFVTAAQLSWLRHLQRQLFAGVGAHLRTIVPDDRLEIRRYDHHLAHAAYAAASSPFDDATCVVIDGEGEVGSTSVFDLRQRRLQRRWRSWGPGSLGAYYSWLTSLCGFDWRAGEEWKVMGLAALGAADPVLVAALVNTLVIDRGRPVLAGPDAFAAARAAAAPFVRRRGAPVEMAAVLAASGQAAYAQLADRVVGAALPDGGGGALVLSGGCALNSAYNGTLRRRFELAAVHVPCAPADDGNAVGAALLAWLDAHPEQGLPRGVASPFLGTRPSTREVAAAARHMGGAGVHAAGDTAAHVARLLADGRIVGVMRGAAEFGPRALGHRSILADPRRPEMKDEINRRVKGREPYRPFAPAVLAESASDWFDDAQPSPYMSFALRWRGGAHDRVPAVVHADGTGRLQTIAADENPWMHDVTTAFARLTGVPIVLNTSFNVMGKPIAHSVGDALAVFGTTGLDALVLDDVVLEKPAAATT